MTFGTALVLLLFNDPWNENDAMFSANVSNECGTTIYIELGRQICTARPVTSNRNCSVI